MCRGLFSHKVVSVFLDSLFLSVLVSLKFLCDFRKVVLFTLSLSLACFVSCFRALSLSLLQFCFCVCVYFFCRVWGEAESSPLVAMASSLASLSLSRSLLKFTFVPASPCDKARNVFSAEQMLRCVETTPFLSQFGMECLLSTGIRLCHKDTCK